MNSTKLIGFKSERISYFKHVFDLTGKYIEFNELDKKNQFDNFFKSLEIKIDNEIYPDWIFFFCDDICYMKLNHKNGNLYCSRKYIWDIYIEDYNMNYVEIQSFIKNGVEEHFKTLPITPIESDNSEMVEEHFKTLPITPEKLFEESVYQVEEHFNNVNYLHG